MNAPAVAWLPNALSAARIALVPVWVAVAFIERARALDGFEPRRFLLLALLAIIGLSDFMDGLLARRLGLTTPLGATIDAVADKLATFAAVTFLAFFGAPVFTPLPIWLWGALLARDLLLGVGYLTLKKKRGAVDATHLWHGRAATLMLFLVVVVACAAGPRELVAIGSALVVAIIVPGTWEYFARGWRSLRRR